MEQGLAPSEAIEKLSPIIKKNLNDWDIEHIKPLAAPKAVLDDTAKFLLFNKQRIPAAVLICGKTEFGNLAGRSAERVSNIRASLQGDEKKAVLAPLDYGDINGLNFALWPYRKPLSGNKILGRLQRYSLRKKILSWLHNATHQTIQKPLNAELEEVFISPLKALQSSEEIKGTLDKRVHNFIGKIESQSWKPVFTMAHNDLWVGNVLNAKDNKYKISVIDWAGSNLKGIAIFDLVKICIDLRVRGNAYSIEVKKACDLLECDMHDSEGYLLASMALLLQNIEHFPRDRFFKLLQRVHRFHMSNLGL